MFLFRQDILLRVFILHNSQVLNFLSNYNCCIFFILKFCYLVLFRNRFGTIWFFWQCNQHIFGSNAVVLVFIVLQLSFLVFNVIRIERITSVILLLLCNLLAWRQRLGLLNLIVLIIFNTFIFFLLSQVSSLSLIHVFIFFEQSERNFCLQIIIPLQDETVFFFSSVDYIVSRLELFKILAFGAQTMITSRTFRLLITEENGIFTKEFRISFGYANWFRRKVWHTCLRDHHNESRRHCFNH